MAHSADLVQELRKQSREVSPALVALKVLEFVINALSLIPVAFGFAVGLIWRFAAFIAISVRYGYWKGAGVQTKPKDNNSPAQ